MFQVAILSFWHVRAQDYAREAEAQPGTEIAAVWDEEPSANRAYARRPNRS
jgi:1,5-anhydro-D-fructose reductase (1,5-anhydro-D-mannitol-forming)